MGLGSCVGIALYDREKDSRISTYNVPDSKQFREVVNPFKYADLGIENLVLKMISRGYNKDCITAKIAGGSSMFNFTDKELSVT